MKGFFLSILVFAGLMANASLKLTLQENLYDQAKKPRSMFGLGWYQPLMEGAALNTWLGVGSEPFEVKEDVDWFTAKSQVDMIFGRFTLSPGLAYKYAMPYDEGKVFPYIRVDFKILD